MREDKRKEKKRKVITSISRSKTELNYNERFRMSNKTELNLQDLIFQSLRSKI